MVLRITLTPPMLHGVGAMNNLSDEGEQWLIHEEGRRLKQYKDSAGYWTIGVGHLVSVVEKATGYILIGPEQVKYTLGLTNAQCDALFLHDVQWAVTCVDEHVTVELTQGEFDVLVSFVYNIGPPKFLKSTLLAKLNDRHYDQVPTQLMRWVFSGGKKDPILVARRKRESQHWKEHG